MRRSEAEGSPNEVSREAVARGRATQVSPNSAYAKHLRSTKPRFGSWTGLFLTQRHRDTEKSGFSILYVQL